MKMAQRSKGISSGILLTVACLALVGAMMFVASERPAEQDVAEVRLQLDWVHAPDFVGYYAADRNGYYSQGGIKVTFLPGGIKIDPTESVLSGKAEFGLASAGNLMQARADNHPVKAIACIYQRNPFAFAAKVGSGIRSPRDFEGRTIRISAQSRPLLAAVMDFVGADASGVTVVHTRDTDLFRSGEVDIWGAYLPSSIRRLRASGLDLHMVHPDDYGVHTYNQCIFTTDDMIANRPDVVRRFLDRTLAGWRYAAENIDEVGLMVEKYGEIESPEEAMAYARATLPLFNTGNTAIGYMDTKIWLDNSNYLKNARLLPKTFDATSVFTLEFISKAAAAS